MVRRQYRRVGKTTGHDFYWLYQALILPVSRQCVRPCGHILEVGQGGGNSKEAQKRETFKNNGMAPGAKLSPLSPHLPYSFFLFLPFLNILMQFPEICLSV